MSALITLKGLAQRPLWVAWQQEDRPDGKATKIPYAPNSRKKARADDPSTWGSRPDAEKRAHTLPKPYGVGGVGLELASLGDGQSLAGIDLDACRSIETGELEAWAEDVVASFDSYAEVSPSGSGAKLYFTYETAAFPSFAGALGDAKFGRQFKRGGGDHPPAIELHLGNRYFAVTDDRLRDSRLDLRRVEPARIQRLLEVNGPAFVGIKSATTRSSGVGQDRSRSSTAFTIGKRLVRDGATFEQLCDVLRSDPNTADWMRDKGQANNCREARRIFEKAQATGPLIRVAGGALHTNASEGEAAIIGAGLPIYQRGHVLVRPVEQEVTAARGRTTISAALLEMTTPSLVDALCSCATWERYDGRADEWLQINPPKPVAETILSRAGMWTLPKIVGVITCPTLRPDGSVLSVAGYDPTTRLYHAADRSLVLSPKLENPTREVAENALELLRKLLAEFPFVGGQNSVSEAVALSGLITPVVRGALAVAPLHAFRANAAGSGKSYLADIASAIATGRPCPVVAAGPDEIETEKRLTGLLLAGFPLLSLDNVNGELGGDLLCQAIERPLIRLRPLGRSDIIEIESRATIFGTGNALRVRGDMTRRTLVSDLDANMERPETRQFKGDPVATVLQDRGRYISACLAIVRAYLLADCPKVQPQLASFSDWSRLVRSALVWLGTADPADSMEAAREDDPELEELREVVALWKDSLGVADSFTVKELADKADERQKTQHGEPTDFAFPSWRDCLLRLSGERGIVNTRRAGQWLMKRESRIVAGHRIKRAVGQAQGGITRWRLEAV